MTQIELERIKEKVGSSLFDAIYNAGFSAGYKKGRDDQAYMDEEDLL